MKHELKIWPTFFEHVRSGNKTFELRKNDRGFQPGDTVELNEFDPEELDTRSGANPSKGKYTGRKLEFTIGYISPVDSERVVFSLLVEP